MQKKVVSHKASLPHMQQSIIIIRTHDEFKLYFDAIQYTQGHYICSSAFVGISCHKEKVCNGVSCGSMLSKFNYIYNCQVNINMHASLLVTTCISEK